MVLCPDPPQKVPTDTHIPPDSTGLSNRQQTASYLFSNIELPRARDYLTGTLNGYWGGASHRPPAYPTVAYRCGPCGNTTGPAAPENTRVVPTTANIVSHTSPAPHILPLGRTNKPHIKCL